MIFVSEHQLPYFPPLVDVKFDYCANFRFLQQNVPFVGKASSKVTIYQLTWKFIPVSCKLFQFHNHDNLCLTTFHYRRETARMLGNYRPPLSGTLLFFSTWLILVSFSSFSVQFQICGKRFSQSNNLKVSDFMPLKFQLISNFNSILDSLPNPYRRAAIFLYPLW